MHLELQQIITGLAALGLIGKGVADQYYKNKGAAAKPQCACAFSKADHDMLVKILTRLEGRE